MKLSCSAYQAGCSNAQKMLSGHMQNYGATSSTAATTTQDSTFPLKMPTWKVEEIEGKGSPNDNSESPNEGTSGQGGSSKTPGMQAAHSSSGHGESSRHTSVSSHSDPPDRHSDSTSKTHDSSRSPSESPAHRLSEQSRSRSKSVGEQQWTNLRAVMAWYGRLRRIKRSRSNQRWMKLRTTVQLSGAITSTIQKKTTLKREDSFLKRFSTRQVQDPQETFEIGEEDGAGGLGGSGQTKIRRKKKRSLPRSVVNPDSNFYFYWLMILTLCVLYNLWTLIVRESFPELQEQAQVFWILADAFTDIVFILDMAVQFRTGYLEQGLMVYKTKKLAKHYVRSRPFKLDLVALTPTDLAQFYFGIHPMFRVPRFLKIYRIYNYYYMVESRTVYPNVWRVVNLIHILLLLAHWFGCFYYLLSEAESFVGPWAYPDPKHPNLTAFASLTRKYLGSLYWSTLTLTTIGDLPTPYSNWQYLFTIVSYLIGVFIFATIVGQVGNVITNRNANRLEFERLLDGAKMYMRHHKVPRDMQRRVLRWYDYSWSRGRIQGGGDINTALGLLPDKLKTELALHVNLSVLKKVTIFQECQPEFLHDLVLKMKAYIFTPGDLICRKGEVAREMFIIADGILEVISEQGRVLTTMQAGDFFGEIGILNLDGLNKRTADVRSVGYSELFSLSREDVLAAMKDYPEAQEILQTLGRKRLMEARRAAGPPAKKAEKKSSPLQLLGHSLHKGNGDEAGGGGGSSSGDTTGKRIVEKLRSDVKGLRNAIRRSRKSNSSKEDSSEPESGKEPPSGATARRKESSVSMYHYGRAASIGGGVLPIIGNAGAVTTRGVLKRMHHVVLSDEKDGSKAGSSSTDPSSPFGISKHSPSFLPKRVQVQLPNRDREALSGAEGQTEVIGAGLPLIQRLRLLRQKEEGERRLLGARTEDVLKKTPSTVLEEPDRPSTSGSSERPNPEPGPSTSAPLVTTRDEMPDEEEPDGAEPSPNVPLDRLSVDSRGTSYESSAESSIAGPVPLGSPRPDSKRPSALHFQKNAKTYGSVDDLSPEFSRLPFIKKLKILNERQKIAELLTTKSSNTVLTRSTSEGSSDVPAYALPIDPDEQNLHALHKGRRTQSSSDPAFRERHIQLRLDGQRTATRPERPPEFLNIRLPSLSSSSSSSSSPSTSDDEEPEERKTRRRKKILQKSSDPSGGSTTSGASVATVIAAGGAASTSEDADADAEGDDGKHEPLRPWPPQAGTSTSPPSPPYSPESNETPERRRLKSILRRHAQSVSTTGEPSSGGEESQPNEDQPTSESQTRSEEHQLLRAATLEGYAARHRKFTKNVTFQRRAVTVVSPDASTSPTSSLPNAAESSSSAGGGEDEGEEDEEDLLLALQTQVTSVNDAGEDEDEDEGDEGGERRAQRIAHHQTRHITPENMKTRFAGLVLMKNGDEGVDHRHPQHALGGIGLSLGLGVAQEECIGGVFLGIKNIIQSKMDEMQLKFQDRFCTLEREVRKRDEIISILQMRIQELEDLSQGGHVHASTRHKQNHEYYEDEDYNEEDLDHPLAARSQHPLQSSYLFGRGDSIDTVIGNTEDLEYDVDDEVFSPPDNESVPLRGSSSASRVLVPDTAEGARDTGDVSSAQTFPLWQLEFHRESFSAGSAPPQPPSSYVDSVTVEIGSSTEYESSSSSGGEEGGGNEKIELNRPMTERKVRLNESDSEGSEEEGPAERGGVTVQELQESDDDDDDDDDDDEEGGVQMTNQNWEVQMLAKEMEKMEDKKAAAAAQVILEEEYEEDEPVVSEIRELQREIEEMRDVVDSGRLSPAELDMLESVLASRNKRVKDLGKAFSTELDGSPRRGLSSKSKKVARSVDDFHPRARPRVGSLQLTHPPLQAHSSHQQEQQAHGSTTLFCRKNAKAKATVKRQASLCETGTSRPPEHEGPRRESAGSLAKFPETTQTSITTAATTTTTTSGSGRSFFSRFSFIRTLSRTFIHHPEPRNEEEGLEGPTPGTSSSIPLQILPSTSRPSTSASSRPIISTISSVVSGEPSSSITAAEASGGSDNIFTIPSVPSGQGQGQSQPSVSSSPDVHHHYVGESQPLLKK